MTELHVPSNNFNLIGSTEKTGSLCCRKNPESTKQWVDPESMSAEKNAEMVGVVRETWRELGSERADALR